jgi:hypothetical protein
MSIRHASYLLRYPHREKDLNSRKRELSQILRATNESEIARSFSGSQKSAWFIAQMRVIVSGAAQSQWITLCLVVVAPTRVPPTRCMHIKWGRCSNVGHANAKWISKGAQLRWQSTRLFPGITRASAGTSCCLFIIRRIKCIKPHVKLINQILWEYYDGVILSNRRAHELLIR